MRLVSKKTSSIMLLFLTSSIFTGCSSSAPKCSDSETVELVKEISREKLIEAIGKTAADQITLAVDAIRTTNSNEKTGAQQCAAELTLNNSSNGETRSIDITYKSEQTDDGDQFVVTVYGL